MHRAAFCIRNAAVGVTSGKPMNSHPAILESVQTMYAAFGRGEIPAILARLADNVDWRLNVDPTAPGAGSIPTFRTFRGPKDVGEFFAALDRDLEFHHFNPVAFLSGGHVVAARVQMELTVRRTKRRLRLESMHVFTFDGAGRVTQFHEFTDTLGIAAAWGAVRAAG